MKSQLKSVLNYIIKFEEDELERVAGFFYFKSFERGDIILQAGAVCTEFYFVQKGSIRTYFIDRKGGERTRYIMLDNWIGTALTSFISQKPSFEFIDALEDCELLCISHQSFFELNKQVDNWKLFYQRILEMAYSFQNEKIEVLVTLTARERYQKILKESPFLFQRVSNKVLASYLGINPETLSRLKSG